MGSRIRGIVILAATLIIIGMVLYICFTILGATFSAFDNLKYLLSGPHISPAALTDYNNLVSTTSGVFQVLIIMIPLSAIGIAVAAIYKLRNPGDEY